MATLDDFRTTIAAARDDITNIAADEARQTALIEKLQGQINSGGLTADEETQALAEVQALKDELASAAAAVPDPDPNA